MAEAAAIYGLSINEAMNLSEKETAYLLDAAKSTMYNMALTSPAMQDLLRQRLSPVVRGIREVRGVKSDGDGGTGSGGTSSGGAIGAPPTS